MRMRPSRKNGFEAADGFRERRPPAPISGAAPRDPACGLSCAAFLAAVTVFGMPAARAQSPQVSPPSLDDALFGDLEKDSVDHDVERELFGPDAKTPPKPEASSRGPLSTRRVDAWNDLLEQELGQAAVDEVQNPLLGIARSMRLVEGLIGENEAGEKTQKIQAEIVADIDTLLKRAQKKCQSCANQSQSVAQREPTEQPKPSQPKEGKPGTQPATTSNVKPGKADSQAPDMAEMMAVIKQVWGELPEKERQQMLQSSIEEFLPKYADMIEQYFKRLAEDRKEPR